MSKKDPFLKETETLRSLRTLEEIEKNPALSQRDLAKQLGVAVGIANACVHTLVRKGLIKVRGDNNRSITYHLTKTGFMHKAELALKWTKNTVSFYSEARRSVAERLAILSAQGAKSIIFYGANELAEIACIVCSESGLEIKGFIRHEGSTLKSISGIDVQDESALSSAIPETDAIVICVDPEEYGIQEKLKEYADKNITVMRLI